jgi:hypothetical protein
VLRVQFFGTTKSELKADDGDSRSTGQAKILGFFKEQLRLSTLRPLGNAAQLNSN